MGGTVIQIHGAQRTLNRLNMSRVTPYIELSKVKVKNKKKNSESSKYVK